MINLYLKQANSAFRNVRRFRLRQTIRVMVATISSASAPLGTNSEIKSLCSFSNSATLSVGRMAVVEYAGCFLLTSIERSSFFSDPAFLDMAGTDGLFIADGEAF